MEPAAGARIEVLSTELADQIAAGEVVERPASVIKELVENAVDAGARRVEVDLEGAGLERIVVLDDGGGIHPDDLPLAITRHATSKVRTAADLLDVVTLGFRGEALASIAAVAHVTLDSRQKGAPVGTRLRARPGLAPEVEPVGMAVGTRIEVARLFANVPARRKFMRSEATEVGQCSETMLRLSVSHPGVHFRLRHGGRVLLDLPAASMPERMVQVLARRTRGTPTRVEGRRREVNVVGFLGPPDAAMRGRHGLFVVVRRRVVQQRELARIVEEAYGDALPSGRHPVAVVLVDPPLGTVDVNVHPQKAEVRFADPQAVYDAVREVLREAFAARELPGVARPEPSPSPAVRWLGEGVTPALDRWSAAGRSASEPRGPGPAAMPRPSAVGAAVPYRLQTRAAAVDYAKTRAAVRDEVALLRTRSDEAPAAAPEIAAPPVAPPEPALQLLTCLPGPLALLRRDDDVLAVDLKRLRSHLVYRRLQQDLGGGTIAAQGLLEPVLVTLAPADVELLSGAAEPLGRLGLVVEPFDAESLRVRAVPAGLRSCIDEPDVVDLVLRILPWLRLRQADQDGSAEAALRAIASTDGADPAPRLAKRWVSELLEQGIELASVPGIRIWRAQELAP